jgi:Protein of unknown function (DUF402)
MAGRFAEGDSVLLRSVYGGHVRWTFPHRYVGDHEGRILLYCGPGNEGRLVPRRDDGLEAVEAWMGGDPAEPWVWQWSNVLRLIRPGDWHDVEVWWDESWSFLGWYVNLQEPLRDSPFGYDTCDLALDVWVEPDHSWSWKDEDHLALLVAGGAISEHVAREIRAVAEHVIDSRPWPTGWESWRPPSTWDPLRLPEGWDVVAPLRT